MPLLRKLRIVASFALIGSVIAGAVFGWWHWSFDVHVPGALLGTLTGLLTLRGNTTPAN
jgi:hypothetical protein